MCIFQYVRRKQFNPLATFDHVYEYKLARFVPVSNMSLQQRGKFIKSNPIPSNLPQTYRVHFKSGYTWRNTMQELMDQPPWLQDTVDFHLQQDCKFNYSEVESEIGYHLLQRTFGEYVIYKLVPEFDGDPNTV